MKYAPILALDEERNEWRIIGVIANNKHGVVLLKVAKHDRLVAHTPALRMIEDTYNREFEEGEVTFYSRDSGEMSSHVETLKTTDPDFIDKYREQLQKSRKFIQIGGIQEMDSENISEHIEALLEKVREHGNELTAAGAGG